MVILKSPFCDAAVRRDEQDTFAIENVRPDEHVLTGQTVDAADLLTFICHGSSSDGFIVVCNAVGLPVQTVRVVIGSDRSGFRDENA